MSVIDHDWARTEGDHYSGQNLDESRRDRAVFCGVGRTVLAPTWTSSAPELITVSETAAVAVGTATVTAATGALSVMRTVQVVSDYRGQYSGVAVITRCVRLSGGGPASSCVVGARFAINALTIDQQPGSSVSGTLNVFNEPTVGSMAGSIDGNDHITTMTGTLRSNGEAANVLLIERWDTVQADGGRQLIGSFGVDLHFQNGFGPQHQDIDFSLTGVTRQQ